MKLWFVWNTVFSIFNLVLALYFVTRGHWGGVVLNGSIGMGCGIVAVLIACECEEQ